jgi:hypothetical protein
VTRSGRARSYPRSLPLIVGTKTWLVHGKRDFGGSGYSGIGKVHDADVRVDGLCVRGDVAGEGTR